MKNDTQHTYTSGNKIADSISEMNFSGNIIPPIWFSTIVNENDKPYLLAIMILSEIVYWYRPVEVRDEETGDFLGYRTKFKKDLLQKSYQSLADYYHVSKRQVTAAVVHLEKIGVIKRVFREVSKNGKVYNNVLFIQLNPDKLRELTYPQNPEDSYEADVDCVDNDDNIVPLSQKNVTGSHKKMGESPTKKCETYTENNTKTNIYSKSILSSHNELVCEQRGQDETEDVEEVVKKQIDYAALFFDYSEKQNNAAINVLNSCVAIAVSVYQNTGKYVKVSGEKIPIGVAIGLLHKLNMFHIRQVIDSFLSIDTEIKNIRAYLLASMINTIRTFEAKEYNTFKAAERKYYDTR